ncbi:MAG: N-acetylornithine carbamoyltransferase [Saprospiraceae bacterium]
MQQFESVADVQDLSGLIRKGLALKANPLQYETLGKGKTLVLLFFNPSLRTRLSTEKAGLNLGMSVINMNAGEGWQLEFEDGAVMNLDKAEHIREAAAVVSQYADIIGIRTFPSLTDKERDYSDFVLHQFMRFASVPIISLESAIRHPLQSLADLITIEEHKTKARPKVVLSWAPHPRALPQAVSNSFIEWVRQTEAELVITHPPGYELAPRFSEGVTLEYNQRKAFEGADFVYAKNWSSFEKYGQILSTDSSWMITPEKMALTDQGKFMHCLPVRRNVVVADGVLDSEASLVIQQANNRTFAAQAVLHQLLSVL